MSSKLGFNFQTVPLEFQSLGVYHMKGISFTACMFDNLLIFAMTVLFPDLKWPRGRTSVLST